MSGISSLQHPEEVKSVDMAVQPVLGFHVEAGFRIGVVAAGQNGNSKCGTLFPGNRAWMGMVSPAQSTCMASPGLCWMRMVAFERAQRHTARQTEYSWRPFARRLHFAQILPTAAQGHARPCQFAVDVRIVGLSILTGCFVPVRKEKLFQIGLATSSERGQDMPCSFAACSTSRTVCVEQCAVFQWFAAVLKTA